MLPQERRPIPIAIPFTIPVPIPISIPSPIPRLLLTSLFPRAPRVTSVSLESKVSQALQ